MDLMDSSARREQFLAHAYRLTGVAAFMGASACIAETVKVEGAHYAQSLMASYYSMVETSPHVASDTPMRVISAAGLAVAGACLWKEVPRFEINAQFLKIVEHYDQ